MAISIYIAISTTLTDVTNVVLARHVPSLAEAMGRMFALGDATRLVSLFDSAGFVDVQTHTQKHSFALPSFDAYYGPFERGGGSIGQALASLPQEVRHTIREQVRRDLNDTGGPVEVEMKIRIASGRR